MLTFQLVSGKHVEGGVKYVTGEVLESSSDLATLFGAKFRRVDVKAPILSAGVDLIRGSNKAKRVVPLVEDLEPVSTPASEPEEEEEAEDDVTADFNAEIVDPSVFTVYKNGRKYTILDEDGDVIEGGDSVWKKNVEPACQAFMEE